MTSTRCFAPAAVVAAALVLAACGGSGDEGAADTVATPVATEAAPVETEPAPVETEPAPVETEPAPVETEPAPVATEPVVEGSCLVGEWIIIEDELNGFYDSIEGSFPEGTLAPTFDITGNVLLTFTETEYIYVADFVLALDVAGQSGTGDATGMVSGTWDVVDDLVVTSAHSR